MIRAYRCAALDTPLAYIRKKIDPRPPGAQKGPYGRSAGRFLATGPDFGPKIRFCDRTPDFVDGPFIALDNIFNFAPSDRFLVAVRPLGGPFSGHRAGFFYENSRNSETKKRKNDPKVPYQSSC